MALTGATAEFLAEARSEGVEFGRTLTIGRQASFAGPLRLGSMLRRNDVWPAGETRRDFYRRFRPGPPWEAEPYLRALGARQLQVLDVSGYEGADVIHDLADPIPDQLEERFDLVLDGGSLEHVFDVRTALANYMRMVRVGGRLVIQTMANNHCGHGFYQFSPELFFRALSEDNGYRVERLHLAEEDPDFSRPVAGLSFPFGAIARRRFAVADPAAAGERALLRTRVGVILLVQAQRISAAPPFARPIHQSDYGPLWETTSAGSQATAERTPGRARAAFRRLVPPEARMALALDVAPRLLNLLDPLRHPRAARRRSFRNRRYYRRVSGR